MRINNSIVIGVGLATMGIGFLGLISRALVRNGIPFHFTVDPPFGPIVAGTLIAALGYTIRRNGAIADATAPKG